MPATIYFSGSISGGREDVALYARIVRTLEEAGHRVLAGAVAQEQIADGGEPLDARMIWQRDLGWLGEAASAEGVLVAEVSKPSLGVGYEIAVARYRLGMRVICLYSPRHTARCSAMLAGDPEIELVEYADDRIAAMLDRLVRMLGS